MKIKLVKESAFGYKPMSYVNDALEDFSKKYGHLESNLVLRIQSMESEGTVEEHDGNYYILDNDDVVVVLIREGGRWMSDWVIYSNLSIEEIYRLVGLNESLNEQSKPSGLKPFEDVEEGDLAIDYNDEQGEVLDKIAYDDYNLDSVEEFLSNYDSTGAMASGLEEGLEEPDKDGEIKMIAVHSLEDNASYVYTYGYDGAYVPEEYAKGGSMNEDGLNQFFCLKCDKEMSHGIFPQICDKCSETNEDDEYHTKFLRDRKKLEKKYKNARKSKKYLDDFDRTHGY